MRVIWKLVSLSLYSLAVDHIIRYAAVNWNLITTDDYLKIVDAAKQIRGEAVITLVRKSVSTGTAFSHEEHEAMHLSLIHI